MTIYRRSIRTLLRLILVAVLMQVFPPAARSNQYTVGTGDTLHINVFGHPDLNQTIEVDAEGMIVFPLLGQLEVAGRSVADLSRALTDKLGAGYIINPQVTVVVEDYRSRKASILGKVNKPGLYELKGRTTLLEMISTAGGLALDAGQFAYVTRQEPDNEASVEGRQEVIRIDLKKLVEAGETTQNILIQDGDSVFISNMEKIYVTGEVKSNGAYPYEEGLTVIMALTNAGGLTNTASASRIRIIRKANGEEQVIHRVKMDDPVLPEDVIVVPESFF